MSERLLNITLIGSGNVATQLGLALKKAGCNIAQVYSRSNGPARALALKLRAQAVTDIKKLTKNSDLYIVAVKDDAVASVIKHLKGDHKFIVHTSGSLPMKILKATTTNYGVLYPLQTLSKGKAINFKE